MKWEPESGAGVRVLLVDDDAYHREALREVLESLEFSVVGEAAWPWVRESIGIAACLRASWLSASTSASRRGSMTCARDSVTISAYARLLMSSEVQAK